MLDGLAIAWHFLHTRYRLAFTSRARLLRWQDRQLQRFLHERLPLAPYYRRWVGASLQDLPVVDKAEVMANFSGMNTAAVTLDAALGVATQAEVSRDFSPDLAGVSVGLSSGTSGNRGIFMANRQERNRWAGILLARLLPGSMLSQLVRPWRPPLRIAFFLRANSNVYTTLSSRRIDFAYYDLFEQLDAALPRLQRQQPDILVAPANVLKIIAQWALDGKLSIAPQRVVSVAEVLEPDDAERIGQAFATRPMQIYQATEGFLGYTCEQGRLHLNETFLHVEPEWLDADHIRFQPIITDFTRRTQMVVRYRLNDILRAAPAGCPCGRAEIAIDAIEGRMDDIVWLADSRTGTSKPLFPDLIRRVMLMAGEKVDDYRVIQRRDELLVELQAGDFDAARQAVANGFADLWAQQSVTAPSIRFAAWTPLPSQNKRRRIYCEQRPQECSPC